MYTPQSACVFEHISLFGGIRFDVWCRPGTLRPLAHGLRAQTDHIKVILAWSCLAISCSIGRPRSSLPCVIDAVTEADHTVLLFNQAWPLIAVRKDKTYVNNEIASMSTHRPDHLFNEELSGQSSLQGHKVHSIFASASGSFVVFHREPLLLQTLPQTPLATNTLCHMLCLAGIDRDCGRNHCLWMRNKIQIAAGWQLRLFCFCRCCIMLSVACLFFLFNENFVRNHVASAHTAMLCLSLRPCNSKGVLCANKRFLDIGNLSGFPYPSSLHSAPSSFSYRGKHSLWLCSFVVTCLPQHQRDISTLFFLIFFLREGVSHQIPFEWNHHAFNC